MPRIYVKFSGLSQIGADCERISSKVDTIQSEFQNTIRQLDWDIRFESNINSTANQISRKLEQYSRALDAYQRFITDAHDKYTQLDEYKKINIADYISPSPIAFDPNRFILVGPGGNNWKDLVKLFGSAGSLFGIVNSVLGAKNWIDWGNVGVSATKTISSIAKDYNNYAKIGRAIGSTNSTAYFWRNFFGFNKVGHASTASSASARFYNNLHNTTSPYKLSGIFDAFTGKKGVVSSVAAWAGVALSGISNAFSNIDEQKKSNGAMSTGRVVAETVTETVIDTAIAYAGSAVIGAAIATVTGSVAAPVVVAAATGAALRGINAGCETVFGVSATEAISDFALNAASAVGNAVTDGTKAVASWFEKLSFA